MLPSTIFKQIYDLVADIEMTDLADRLLRDYVASLAPIDQLIVERESAGADDAARTLKKLYRNEVLSSTDRFRLEAIIIPGERPALVIDAKGVYDEPKGRWASWDRQPFRDQLSAAFPYVGRVELPDHPSLPYAGTGFVVGDNLIMTNRHVAELFALGVGDSPQQLSFHRAAGFAPYAEKELLKVRRVVMIHPHWDMALLQVDGLDAGSLHLLSLPVEEIEDHEIAIVGYPGIDWHNPAGVREYVFHGCYYIKRLQPGILRKRRSVASYDELVSSVTHDASTLSGSSGSAALLAPTRSTLERHFHGALDLPPVAALHFAGRYLDANFAVPAGELAMDQRIWDAGVRFYPDTRPIGSPAAWIGKWEGVSN